MADDKAAQPHPASIFRPGQKHTLESIPAELFVMIMDFCADGGDPGIQPQKSLKALSCAAKAIRQLCIPRLFTRIRLGGVRHIGPYDSAVAATKTYFSLVQLAESEDILSSIRCLVIHLYQQVPLHYGTPLALLKALNKMPNLVEVGMIIFSKQQSLVLTVLESLMAYSEERLYCPTVKNLWLDVYSDLVEHGPDLSYLTKAFPHLENVQLPRTSGQSIDPLIRELGSSAHLQVLVIDKGLGLQPRDPDKDTWTGWTIADVEALYKLAPSVKRLGLKGQLENIDINELVPAISRFDKLCQLDITDEQVITYDELEWIEPSDMSDHEYDEMLDEVRDLIIDHPLNGDRHETACSFFQDIPSLQRICFVKAFTDDCEIFDAKRSEGGGEVEAVEYTKVWHGMWLRGYNPAGYIDLTQDSWPTVMLSTS